MIKEIWILDRCKNHTGKWETKAYIYYWYFPSRSGRRYGREVVLEPYPTIFILALMSPLVGAPSKVTKTSQDFHFFSREIASLVYQPTHIIWRKEKVN